MTDAPLTYTRARRKAVGVLIMLAGPSGSGKTLSALRLAKGLAGPDGRVAFADTEHDRALYYADAIEFLHLSVGEPFRPSKFEQAAVAAQEQSATVWVCDNFSHEHVGPGGMLDYHEDELQRMAGNDYDKRERLNFAAWIRPKTEHKKMLQRLWQLNVHIILTCQAENKIALVKSTDPKDKGRIKPVDRGLVPVCGSDIPYAMTMSFMLEPKAPGVPVVIKPLLPDLHPIIDLSAPLDELTGSRIAAWARGNAPAAKEERPPGPWPPGPPPESTPKPPSSRAPDADAVAETLCTRFAGTTDRADHLAIVDEAIVRQQVDWLRKKRPELHARVQAAVKVSWARTDPHPKPEPAQQELIS